MLDNREWATLIWLAVFVFWMLSRRDLRGPLGNIVTLFLTPKLLAPITAMAAYVVGLVLVARSIGLWTDNLIDSTVVWFLAGAMLLFFHSTRVSEETGFLRRASRRAIGMAALVEGFVNLYVFPLAIELILIPLLAILGGMVAVADYKDEFEIVRKPLNTIASCIGIGVLVCVVGHVVSDWSGAHLAEDLLKLALPIWLTIAVLPFIYVVGLLMAYESSFLRIDLTHREDGLTPEDRSDPCESFSRPRSWARKELHDEASQAHAGADHPEVAGG